MKFPNPYLLVRVTEGTQEGRLALLTRQLATLTPSQLAKLDRTQGHYFIAYMQHNGAGEPLQEGMYTVLGDAGPADIALAVRNSGEFGAEAIIGYLLELCQQ